MAKVLNQATKYVATNSLTKLGWQNSTIIHGDAASKVSRLKAETGPLIQVHGSQALIQTLLAADLIDEFRLWTFPTILSDGTRLFENEKPLGKLLLQKTEACPNGVIMSVYRRP